MSISGTTFSPANVVSPVLPVTPQPIHRAALDAPTITDFPSPPIASIDAFGIINNQNLIGGGNFVDNTFQNPVNTNMSSNWNMPTGNPSQDQGQNFYNPAGSPHVLPPQQPPSNFISTAAQPPPPAPSSGYMSTGSNPMSPASNMSNVPFGYGANNNNNLYQAPVVPSPGPSVPAQPPYGQPAFTAPSAPFQQPQPSSQQSYAPIPIVLDPEINTKVQKHCKWTVSALTYDDVPAAIDNLEKALALLRVSVFYMFIFFSSLPFFFFFCVYTIRIDCPSLLIQNAFFFLHAMIQLNSHITTSNKLGVADGPLEFIVSRVSSTVVVVVFGPVKRRINSEFCFQTESVWGGSCLQALV